MSVNKTASGEPAIKSAVHTNISEERKEPNVEKSESREEQPCIQNELPASTINQNSKQIPWKDAKKIYSCGIMGLHEEIQDFVTYISPTLEETLMRNKIIERVSTVIKDLWPEAQTYVFGSFKTGLYLPTSDIDMVLFGYWEQLPLRTIENALLTSGTAKTVTVIDKAAVPIVKMKDNETGITVDISFNMGNGLKAVRLIQDYQRKYPCLSSLVLVLKHFLVIRDLNEVWSGGISSYALILMCVSYLEHKAGINFNYANYGCLLLGFLGFFGRYFNYHATAIRIRQGYCFVTKDVMQREMDNGYRPSILCIEDPLMPGNDIGRSSYGALQVKRAFEHAYMNLTCAVLPQYAQYGPWVSILSRIIHMTPALLEARAVATRACGDVTTRSLAESTKSFAEGEQRSDTTKESHTGQKRSYAQVAKTETVAATEEWPSLSREDGEKRTSSGMSVEDNRSASDVKVNAPSTNEAESPTATDDIIVISSDTSSDSSSCIEIKAPKQAPPTRPANRNWRAGNQYNHGDRPYDNQHRPWRPTNHRRPRHFVNSDRQGRPS